MFSPERSGGEVNSGEGYRHPPPLERYFNPTISLAVARSSEASEPSAR